MNLKSIVLLIDGDLQKSIIVILSIELVLNLKNFLLPLEKE